MLLDSPAAQQKRNRLHALATGTIEFRSFLPMSPLWVFFFCIQIRNYSSAFHLILSLYNSPSPSCSSSISFCLGFGFIKADCFGEHAHTHFSHCALFRQCYFCFLFFFLHACRMRKLWEMKRPVITNGNRRAQTLFTKVAHTSRLIIIINNLLFCIVCRLLRYTWTNPMCSCEQAVYHTYAAMEWNGWDDGEAHNGKWKTKETDKQTEKIAEIMTGKSIKCDSILFCHFATLFLFLIVIVVVHAHFTYNSFRWCCCCCCCVAFDYTLNILLFIFVSEFTCVSVCMLH